MSYRGLPSSSVFQLLLVCDKAVILPEEMEARSGCHLGFLRGVIHHPSISKRPKHFAIYISDH